MTEITHCFIYPVQRPEDPFLGLKHLLSKQRLARHVICEARLAPEEYELVRKIEYSRRRYARFFYYKPVFQKLEELLTNTFRRTKREDWLVLYLSDEGVWAEFLRDIRKRFPGRKILSVNVQHGLAYPVPSKYKAARRAINWALRKVWGYPAFGMGSLGGAGAGAFDIYLAYDKILCDFISDCTGDLVYACPSIIKYGLFQRFQAANSRAKFNGARKRVMFAAQPMDPVIFSPAKLNGNLIGVFRELSSVAQLLAEKHGQKMLFRFHPGMERDETMAAFQQGGISRHAEIDEIPDLAESLARCDIVMSLFSTVLWEASVLGLVPVSVHGAFHQARLPFPHEVLDVSADLDVQLNQILCPETAQKYRRGIAEEAFDWENIIVSFATDAATATVSSGQTTANMLLE